MVLSGASAWHEGGKSRGKFEGLEDGSEGESASHRNVEVLQH